MTPSTLSKGPGDGVDLPYLGGALAQLPLPQDTTYLGGISRLSWRTSAIWLFDLSQASHSIQALRLLESLLQQLADSPDMADEPEAPPILRPAHICLQHLVLTRAVLQKMAQQLRERGLMLQVVYSLVPQTQQAALQEGFFVREFPLSLGDVMVTRREAQATSEGAVDAQTPAESLDLSLTHALPEAPAPEETLEATTSELEDVTAQGEETPAAPTGPVGVDPEAFIAPQLDLPRFDPDKLLPTLMLKQTLRSGQSVHYPGHVLIVGDVNAGAEITAKGDVVVWGVLKGVVHAGSEGDRQAVIRAHRIDALQLRIADILARRTERGYPGNLPRPSGEPGPTLPPGLLDTQGGGLLTQVAEVHQQEIRIRISRI